MPDAQTRHAPCSCSCPIRPPNRLHLDVYSSHIPKQARPEHSPKTPTLCATDTHTHTHTHTNTHTSNGARWRSAASQPHSPNPFLYWIKRGRFARTSRSRLACMATCGSARAEALACCSHCLAAVVKGGWIADRHCMCVCVFIHRHTHMYVYTHIRTSVYVCIYVCSCAYIHTYIHTYIYIHIYTYNT